MKPTIDISAVQLRRQDDRLQVLIETDGVWRLAIDHPWPSDGTGLISHIAEANGKFGWALVEPGLDGAVVTSDRSNYNPKACIPCASCRGMRRENCKDYPNHGHEWCDCQ